MTPEHTHRHLGHWSLLIFGVILAILGLILLLGGIRLIVLGGSWYYGLAGIGILIAGIQLIRGRLSGVWWYAAVFVGTFFWTLWEVGFEYWGWVPRFGLIVVMGFILALLMPLLNARPSKKLSGSLAGLCALIFIAFFALAFVPHGVTPSNWSVATATPSPASISPLPLAGGVSIQPVNAPDTGDWPAYGRSNAALRYVPLSQINRDNVVELERAWVYRTGDLPEERWGAETTPIEVDGRLYLCSATNDLMALDAATGEELWRFEHDYSADHIPYTAACRGVAYYEVPAAETAPASPDPAGPPTAAPACSPRIIEGTLDHRLIAVDADTGELCTGFGNNGMVDISRGMGEVTPGMVSITAAPIIVRGVIVTGHQVLDGIELEAPSGVIQGFDAVTGELLWAWDMARPALEARPPPGETYTRGTPNMWTTASADEALGLVYLPMGNAAGDFLSRHKTPRENEFATSLVAIDVTTGELAWHFQTVHMDVWDYDLGTTGTLVEFPTNRGPVPAIILSSKQGDIYVLDRRTGEPITGVEERSAPQGGVEPEQRTRTQPFSLYHTLRQDRLTERDMWGITPFDQLYCRIQYQKASYQGIYTPPTAKTPYIQYPGYNGGSDWGGLAVDPRRGVIVANYNDIAMYNQLIPREDLSAPVDLPTAGSQQQLGAPYAIALRAGWRVPLTKMPCKQPPYGGIRAIDLASGETIWDRPFGTARSNGPFGIPTHLPILIGTPNNGGAVVTASGLIFIAAATDNLIRAIDIETGETLWQDVLPAGGQANPMVYAVDGREYLVIMAGGHHFMETPRGDHVIAYALPAPSAGARP